MRRLLQVLPSLVRARRWTVLVGIAGGLLLVAVLLGVIVYVPQLAIDPRSLTHDQWLTHAQNLRTSILQGLGGLAVLAGAIVAALNLRETSRQNRAVLELQRRGQTTERFTRAIEQLGQPGPEKHDVRIGAVYALEQIARDSAELHWPIMEVLTAYLREHAPVRALANAATDDSGPKSLPADHQAIATVIGRRNREQDPAREFLTLNGTDLAGVRWLGAHLEGARLYQARLEGADLRTAHVEETHLAEAHLEDADLREAHLEGADLHGAHLERAWLLGAHLERTCLHSARGLVPGQLRSAADPERAILSVEQTGWLRPASAAEAPSSAASDGGSGVAAGPDSDRR